MVALKLTWGAHPQHLVFWMNKPRLGRVPPGQGPWLALGSAGVGGGERQNFWKESRPFQAEGDLDQFGEWGQG